MFKQVSRAAFVLAVSLYLLIGSRPAYALQCWQDPACSEMCWQNLLYCLNMAQYNYDACMQECYQSPFGSGGQCVNDCANQRDQVDNIACFDAYYACWDVEI